MKNINANTLNILSDETQTNTTNGINLVGESVNISKFSRIDNLLREGGTMSVNANKVPGMNSMSLVHDYWTTGTILQYDPLLRLSIIPATTMQYCATFPALCGAVTIIKTNKGIKNEK